jgi:hypothetical protein
VLPDVVMIRVILVLCLLIYPLAVQALTDGEIEALRGIAKELPTLANLDSRWNASSADFYPAGACGPPSWPLLVCSGADEPHVVDLYDAGASFGFLVFIVHVPFLTYFLLFLIASVRLSS